MKCFLLMIGTLSLLVVIGALGLGIASIWVGGYLGHQLASTGGAVGIPFGAVAMFTLAWGADHDNGSAD